MAARRDQRHAGRKAVAAEARRHRQRAEVEQVDEVGIGAKLAVGADRIGVEVGDRARPRERRHHQHVDAFPQRLGLAAQVGQLVEPVEGVGGAVAGGGRNDLQRRRMQFVRCTFDQAADGVIALGDPGSAVEQVGDREQRRHVDRRGHCIVQQRRQIVARGVERGFRQRIAAEFAACRIGHPDAQPRRHRAGPCGDRQRPREAVGGVVSLHDAIDGLSILDRAREHRQGIERPAGRHHAARRHAAQGRFEADDVVECRRHAARSRRVGADREADEAVRYRHRRAAARAARHISRVAGVARHRIGRADPHQAGGELVEIGLADHDRAGLDQPLHRERGLVRRMGESGAGGGGRQSRDIDIVLHREGNAP